MVCDMDPAERAQYVKPDPGVRSNKLVKRRRWLLRLASMVLTAREARTVDRKIREDWCLWTVVFRPYRRGR
jgi:hypothetical protein